MSPHFSVEVSVSRRSEPTVSRHYGIWHGSYPETWITYDPLWLRRQTGENCVWSSKNTETKFARRLRKRLTSPRIWDILENIKRGTFMAFFPHSRIPFDNPQKSWSSLTLSLPFWVLSPLSLFLNSALALAPLLSLLSELTITAHLPVLSLTGMTSSLDNLVLQIHLPSRDSTLCTSIYLYLDHIAVSLIRFY